LSYAVFVISSAFRIAFYIAIYYQHIGEQKGLSVAKNQEAFFVGFNNPDKSIY